MRLFRYIWNYQLYVVAFFIGITNCFFNSINVPSLLFKFMILTTAIMVGTVLIDDLFDLLEEFNNIFGSIQLPFHELLQCCDFYCECGYSD